MNCADLRQLLHAHVDGELDAASSLELQRHLKTCAKCAAEEKSLLSLKAALQEAPLRHQAPALLRNHVRQLSGASKRESRSPATDLSSFWKWLALGATAFALLTLMLRPAGISERNRFLDEAVSGHVRSLMAEHLMDVASSDQHTVKPGFDGKLDFAPDVKDFVAQGFPLIGGRLDYLHGHAAAALVYQHNKHFINVFISPVAKAEASSDAISNYHGYNVVIRDVGGFHYWLVSDLNKKELGELADLLGK